MKALVVGDPHMKPEDLEEGRRLVDLISATAEKADVDAIILMGDLFHTHSVVHVEVMAFWRQVIADLSQRWRIIVIKGNHDGPHEDALGVHALIALVMPNVFIVDRPRSIDGIMFLPFMRDASAFVSACRDHPGYHTLYCHQEFNGCKYDNGFYSKDGADPDAIPQSLVISGHIHSGQEFGKVWYVGAPRWMTASDANQDRFLWVIEHDAEGKVVARTSYPTDPACQRLVRVEDRPEAPVDPTALPAGAKVMVDIHGPQAWVEERKALWAGKARVRAFATDERQVKVRESDGIPVAFQKFFAGFEPKWGTPKDLLAGLVAQRLPGMVAYV